MNVMCMVWMQGRKLKNLYGLVCTHDQWNNALQCLRARQHPILRVLLLETPSFDLEDFSRLSKFPELQHVRVIVRLPLGDIKEPSLRMVSLTQGIGQVSSTWYACPFPHALLHSHGH